ncbi:uncharacterized protein BKCO1_5000057 [Diplodia corticola]|uniref:Uncharacterized protein n=1 Tax=Diplodia corticola TaxID=236234 RepID=A0A1J9QS78_9PEZI|nr:uncharacterized protein BKCO1_5000057 [Diplodia corticola]OJD31304.1 hypothetical protein BKCO1_5000057 [Diplodia corticola]
MLVDSKSASTPSKRNRSAANTSDEERPATDRARRTPRKLRTPPYSTMRASASKRRRTQEVSSSSDEVTPIRKARRVTVESLVPFSGQHEAPEHASDGGSIPKQPMDGLKISHKLYSTDERSDEQKGEASKLSDKMEGLVLADKQDSAHEANQTDSMTKTAPSKCASESQPTKRSELTRLPSTTVLSDTPTARNDHATYGMHRVDPALTYSERVHKIIHRNPGKLPSTYTINSRAPASSNSTLTTQHWSAADGNDHEASNTQSRDNDNVTSPESLPKPAPGESCSRAHSARPGVDPTSAATTAGPGIDAQAAGNSEIVTAAHHADAGNANGFDFDPRSSSDETGEQDTRGARSWILRSSNNRHATVVYQEGADEEGNDGDDEQSSEED